MLKILKELEQIKKSLTHLDGLPAVEKDLILEKLRDLYQTSLNIDIINETKKDDSFDLDEAPREESGKPTADMTEAEPETETDSSATDENKKEHAQKAEQEKEPVEKIILKKEKEETKSIPRPPDKGTIADQFKSGQSYINESMARKSQTEDLSLRLSSKPIQDISDAIGINDKYQLIRDLFKGNPEIFEATIDKLNHASNFNEAFNYINLNFDWEMEDESVQLLLDLVRRKFIVNDNS